MNNIRYDTRPDIVLYVDTLKPWHAYQPSSPSVGFRSSSTCC